MSAWKGLYVTSVTYENNQDEAILLLLSIRDKEVSSSELSETTASYYEKDFYNWRLPTEDEMSYFYSNRTEIDTEINDNSTIYGDKWNDKSYFCAAGEKYFNMATGNIGNIATSGKFRLRLVKTVKVKKVATN
jgi:hypothetical protein